MKSHALRADILMLVTAMIWGVSFVAQRLGMDAIGPFLYTGLRFALGALMLLPLLAWSARRGAQPFNRGLLLAGLAIGTALTLGINLQQVGLLFTSVTNSGSVGFHRRLGFGVTQVEDYDGPGVPMMVMTRSLPWTSASASPAPS